MKNKLFFFRPLRSALTALLLFFTGQTLAAESYAVYLYLCGSDLESNYGCASQDLSEIVDSRLGSNVRVIVETGGAMSWQNSSIKAGRLQRFLFEGQNGGDLVSESPDASMGDEKTFEDFLSFCQQKYPADHQMVIVWNHGGGSVYGVAYDERHNDDYLSMEEIQRAFRNVYGEHPAKLPFDIIGFDCCLMSTLDLARVVQPFGLYMVASQATEPGCGWNYTEFLNGLAKDTSQQTLNIAKLICNSYIKGCAEIDQADEATLSAVYLPEIPKVDLAYNVLGLEAAGYASHDNSFYSLMGRTANNVENYSNSKAESSFSNMVDLGAFADGLKGKIPKSVEELKKALESAVHYKVSGRYYKPSGLSIYYPYDGANSYGNMYDFDDNLDSMLVLYGLQLGLLSGSDAQGHLDRIFNNVNTQGYTTAAAPTVPSPSSGQSQSSSGSEPSGSAVIGSPIDSQQGTTGLGAGNYDQDFSSSMLEIIGNPIVSQAISSLQPVAETGIEALEDHAVEVDDEGNATLDIGPENARLIDDVSFYLGLYDTAEDFIVMLGKDSNINADWDKGVFKDNFDGTWAALNDHLVDLEYTRCDDDYKYYYVPVIYNGRRSILDVVYEFDKGEYIIRGARRVLGNGKPDKVLNKLQQGDTIVTLFQMSKLSDDSDFSEIEYESFKLGSSIKMEDLDLGDCTLMMMFEMSDVKSNTVTSDLINIEIKGDTMYYGGEEI